MKDAAAMAQLNKVEEIYLMVKKKKNEITIRSSAAEYLTYVAATGDNSQSFEMRYEDENIWLTQKMMATLYDVETHTINYHIKKIFSDSELDENSVIRNFRITAADGKQYNIIHYNLAFKMHNDIRYFPAKGVPDWCDIFFLHLRHVETVVRLERNGF